MFVMSAFHPSFVHNLHEPFNRSVEFRVHCVVWVCWLSKLGWKGLMTYQTKIPIPKSDGVFGKMQIISNGFKILKHISDWFIILEVIDAKSPVCIFIGTICTFLQILECNAIVYNHSWINLKNLIISFGTVEIKNPWVSKNPWVRHLPFMNGTSEHGGGGGGGTASKIVPLWGNVSAVGSERSGITNNIFLDT